jgi:hypothetical protein
MSPKAKKAEKPAKAAKAAKSAKTEKAEKPGKKAKGKAAEEVVAKPAEEGVDVEELEEAAEEAAAKSGGGNAAALAAASGTTEMSASFKNFRHHPDMENFYRFIYENDLRHEALEILDAIIVEKQAKKAAAKGGKAAH